MTNIYLIGFMGAGKTSVGRELADRLGYEFIDMDVMIEDQQQCTISEIFANHGEPHFRKLETELVKYLATKNNLVIGTGGGAILNQDNVDTMKGSGSTILLSVKPETILKRLKGDTTRPLLMVDDKLGKINSILDSRKEKYRASAEVIVQTDDKNVFQIVDEILTKIS